MRVKITIVIGLVAGALSGCSIEEKLQKKKDDEKKSSSDDATAGSGRFKDSGYLCVPEATEEEEAGLNLAESASWDGEVSALVQNKCVACHGAGGKPYAPDLTTYDLAKASGEAVVQQVVDGLMPTSGKLPDAEVAAFQAWADGGYLKAAAAAPAPAKPANKDADVLESNRCPVPVDEPAGDDGAGDDAGADDGATDGGATLVGYDQVKDFVNGTCATAGCHVVGATSPDLSDFAKAKAGGVRSNVRIQANTMPPGGGLSPEDQALFQKWVDGNYAEKGE